MTLNSDAKLQQTLTLRFQKLREELSELSLEHLDGLFLSKAYVSVRNFRRIICHDTAGLTNIFHLTKVKGKMTCGLKNDTMKLVNFHVSHQKFENFHFDRILLSKVYKDLDEKVQKSYVS